MLNASTAIDMDTTGSLDPRPQDQPPVNTGDSTSHRLSSPDRWLEDHGEALLKYASVRLRDHAKAEDLVQEVFLAALKSGQRFEGRSSERSWLIGILKNKILDHFRKAGREKSFTDLDFYSETEKEPFNPSGLFKDCWNHDLGPSEWEKPGAALDAAEFWKVFEGCTGKLPQHIAQIFVLREMEDLSTEELCSRFEITQNNLWVMLHRARAALRRCLEMNWFGAHTDVHGAHSGGR